MRSLKILGGGLVLLVLLSVVWLSLRFSGGIQVLDERIELVAVRMSYGTEHAIYRGNQIEGKLRDLLRRFRIKVRLLPLDKTHTQTNAYALMLGYRGDIPHDELCCPQVELVDRTGAAIDVRYHSGTHSILHQEYWGAWVVDSPITNAGPLFLRVSLPDSGIVLLEGQLRSTRAR